jgi:hypothetical protein
MHAFEFTFVVGGVDPHAADFEDRFFEAGCDDATLALMHGAVAACFVRASGTYKEAVFSAYADILKAGATVERFEPDYLVTEAEIAARTALSRQAVNNYAKGERGEGFPKPMARITTKHPLWDWVEVSRWLVKRGTIGEEQFRFAQVSRVINAGAQMHLPLSAIRKDVDQALAEAV